MSTGPADPNGATGAGEPVGSLGEEAAKLFGALSQWSREQAKEQADNGQHAAHAAAEALRGVNEHLATGGEDCRYCPVCQVIHAVRDANPEVRQHLASAAGSMLHAMAGLLETTRPAASGDDDPASGVRKIDLDEDDSTE